MVKKSILLLILLRARSKLVLVILLLSVSFCLSNKVEINAQESVPPTNEPGPYQVGHRILFKESDNSDLLPVYIFYPSTESGKDTPIDRLNSPYPALYVIPGFSMGPLPFKLFAERVSSHGYIVIIPGPGANSKATERSEVQGIALEWTLSMNNNQSSWMNNLVDERKLAVSGHSAGGAASVISASQEPRYNACIPMAPALFSPYSEVGPEYCENVKMPLLLLVGEDDLEPYDLLTLTHEAYNASHSPKILISVPGVNHGWMKDYNFEQYIVPFLKVYLEGDEAYASLLYGDVSQSWMEEGKHNVFFDLSEEVEEINAGSETEGDSDLSGGIPGYPIESILISLALVSLLFTYSGQQGKISMSSHARVT